MLETIHHILTFEHLIRMGLELFLAVCIKLFCDHGRIHWRDLVNDLFFWVPGFRQLPSDGLSRQVGADQDRDSVRDATHVQVLNRNLFVVAMIGVVMFSSAAIWILST